MAKPNTKASPIAISFAGTHVELGIALALGKLIVIVFTETVEMKTFYYLPNVHKFTTEEEAFNFVTERCK
jgi:nucleoside 2-deoxyribosyltransferase